MAIYSLHHHSIGKSTQAKSHTSAAHVRYITRSSAASRVEARRMPERPHHAAAYLTDAENRDRKNARVADKVMLALPRELTGEQRAALVRGFAEEVTQGRAPWLAAFHDRGKDAQNPHVHLLIRDRDPATGKRVAELSEKGSTARLREAWERHANAALEQAGREERIDRRTLAEQGIDREPTVHEGPKAQQMDRRGAHAASRMRRYRNRAGAKRAYRDVDYRAIDGGRSRPAYNRHIRHEGPEDYWEMVDDDRQARELDELRLIHHPAVTEASSMPARDAGRKQLAKESRGAERPSAPAQDRLQAFLKEARRIHGAQSTISRAPASAAEIRAAMLAKVRSSTAPAVGPQWDAEDEYEPD